MKRYLLYFALPLIAILLLSSCEKTSQVVPQYSHLTYITYDNNKINVHSNAFDANIAYHEYNDGFGIILFESPVKYINNYAFRSYASLTSVTIPDSVIAIGEWAFYGCNKLTSVYCQATTPPALGYGAFQMNDSNRIIFVPIESVEAYKKAQGWRDYADRILGLKFD